MSLHEFLETFDTSLGDEAEEVLRFVAERLDATWSNRVKPADPPRQ